MIIGLIIKYAGAIKDGKSIKVDLMNNLTAAPQMLWVNVKAIGNFSYQLKGILHDASKSGNELQEMVSEKQRSLYTVTPKKRKQV